VCIISEQHPARNIETKIPKTSHNKINLHIKIQIQKLIAEQQTQTTQKINPKTKTNNKKKRPPTQEQFFNFRIRNSAKPNW
jgi:hypothetical protein